MIYGLILSIPMTLYIYTTPSYITWNIIKGNALAKTENREMCDVFSIIDRERFLCQVKSIDFIHLQDYNLTIQ